MIEIIPNWHPIFVHFTITLFSLSTIFFIAGALAPKAMPVAFIDNCTTFAKWNLWAGTIVTIGTLLAGWLAYNSVIHDEPSHAVMTNHKDWAFVTSAIFVVLAIWSVRLHFKKHISNIFIIFMIIASLFLATTAFKGGEAVYRYGLGVMSLPQTSEHGHAEGAAPHDDAEEVLGHNKGENNNEH